MATSTPLPSYSQFSNPSFMEAEFQDPPPDYVTCLNQYKKMFPVQQHGVCAEKTKQQPICNKVVYKMNDYRASSITIGLLCALLGTPLTLMFSLPSIVYAFSAVKSAKKGAFENTVYYGRKSLFCGSIAFIVGCAMFVLLTAVIPSIV